MALLPAIAIQAYNEFDQRRARILEIQNQALGLAKLTAAEQIQIIQGIRQVLVALSELPAIKAKDSQACNSYLAAVNQRFPAFLIFIVTDLTGQSSCNTTNHQEPVTAAGRAYFANALKSGGFTVGEFAVGRQTGRNVLHFALPYYGDDGRMVGVIIASLSLDSLADSIARKGVPPRGAIAITDRNGTYLARYPDNDRFVGRKMPNDEYRSLDHPGTADARDLDGVERVFGYSPVGNDAGGLLVSYGLDKAQAFAEIQHRTERGIFLIALSTSLVLVMTWFGARHFIHRPLGQLVEAANEWRLGDYARRVNIQGRAEIGRVADAFNIMAGALEQREQELQRVKEKAEEAATRITTIFESTTDSVLIVGRDWRISYLNKRASEQIAEGREVIGMHLREAFVDITQEAFSRFQQAMSIGRPASFEAFCAHSDTWFMLNAYPSDQGLALYFRNITEHKKGLEAHRVMEEQLHQSQKMEAAGQLTGGIAHDFNNLLTVVALNLEAIEGGSADETIREFAPAAPLAAAPGAKLTAQLLAFSRQQRLEPKLVSVNQIICEFQGLISRAVGAGCELKLLTDEDLWLCHVDPAQLQTALLNLALNARDAMEGGGHIEIETHNAILDKDVVAGCLAGP